LTEQRDVDKGFRSRENREQTQQQDFVQRIKHLAALARIRQWVLVSDVVRRRSFSPSSSALRQGTFASALVHCRTALCIASFGRPNDTLTGGPVRMHNVLAMPSILRARPALQRKMAGTRKITETPVRLYVGGEADEFCDPSLTSVSADDELRLDLLLKTIGAMETSGAPSSAGAGWPPPSLTRS
jgi:hypothetical protein